MGQGEIGWLMNDFSLIFYVATENTPCFQLLSQDRLQKSLKELRATIQQDTLLIR